MSECTPGRLEELRERLYDAPPATAKDWAKLLRYAWPCRQVPRQGPCPTCSVAVAYLVGHSPFDAGREIFFAEIGELQELGRRKLEELDRRHDRTLWVTFEGYDLPPDLAPGSIVVDAPPPFVPYARHLYDARVRAICSAHYLEEELAKASTDGSAWMEAWTWAAAFDEDTRRAAMERTRPLGTVCVSRRLDGRRWTWRPHELCTCVACPGQAEGGGIAWSKGRAVPDLVLREHCNSLEHWEKLFSLRVLEDYELRRMQT